jgi:hypothetical protein
MGLLSWWIEGAAGMGLLSWWIEGAAGLMCLHEQGWTDDEKVALMGLH